VIRRIPLPLIMLTVIVVLMLIPRLAGFYTDWLWFGEVGYRQVFLKSITTQLALGAVTFVIAFGLLYGNLRAALSQVTRPYLVFGSASAGQTPVVVGRSTLGWVVMAAAGFVALLIALYAASQWMMWLQYRNGMAFGAADPILARDAGFYVFQLPFYEFARGTLLLLALIALAGSVGLYLVSGVVDYDMQYGLLISRGARRHLSMLAAFLLVLLAVGAYLEVPRLMLLPSGIIDGASYTDVHARLPALRLLMVASVAGAALAMYHAFTPKAWPIMAAFGLYFVVWLGGEAYATILQRFFVVPNEQVRETPYIVHNIAATRKAFNLEGIEERQLSGDALLTREDIERNADTIRNVRLWDHQPLLDTFGQIQEIRTYYDFVSVDNDRYVIDGQYRQIMLSARELNTNSLPNRTWINERLTFTHGYGVTLGPVNEVTTEGLPVLFIKNLPPESSVDLRLDEPSLYFGELSSDHVFVKTNTREFHYPKGDDNIFSTYEGDGGVNVGTFARKALFALRFGSLKILLSDDIQRESRVIFHRNINQRLNIIAPFLTYDGDPYLVISEGRLFWIRDAYTVSNRYPYSSRATSTVNYIRNSIKVVIDAYHGTTTFYLADPNDPIALTLSRIFPDMLRPLDELSDDLRSHLRYPEGIFSMQTAMFATYHMTNPAVFYNKEDQWEVPAIDVNRQAVPMSPYYTIMRLPGEESAEFIQMLPFTPRRKDNLAAWMVARSDAEHYGKLLVFAFPKQKVIFGPRQVVARISQDQVISPQITLWNQQGSEVIQGTLLVIPIEESLIYIRPLYLRAQGGRIPELKRVIVAYQNQIVMEETLDEALDRIFGPPGRKPAIRTTRAESAEPLPIPDPSMPAQPAAPETSTSISPELASQAQQHYQRALQAQREGNWALYGEELRRLGEVLERMSKR
jgi:uncharacterized protein